MSKKPSGYWTYENVKKEAENHKTVQEFRNSSPTAYAKAYKNNWIKDFDWLIDTRFDIHPGKIDSVYVYEFIEQNSVYVGRTLMRNQKLRDYQHLFGDDSVSRFAKSNNVSMPKMKILEENLTLKEGCEREGYWVEKYKSEGWTILNIAKTGSIGGVGKKWTYSTVRVEAMKYKTKTELRYSSPSAYQKALKYEWINDFDWFEDGNKLAADRDRKWTYEAVRTEAIKYKTRYEFSENSESAYKVALQNNWINDFDWFVSGFNKGRRKWTYETAKTEAMKYKTRSEFRKNAAGAINAAIEEGWINEYTWFEDGNKLAANNRKIWDYETTKTEAMKYKSRWDFGKNNGSAYKVALQNGWIDEFFPKTD